MAHYHKSRNQQAEKWKRFQSRYGMTHYEFQLLKKSNPAEAQAKRIQAYKLFLKSCKVSSRVLL